MLITDANILVRCVIGRAMARVDQLQAQRMNLGMTEHALEEVVKVLGQRLDYGRSFIERGLLRLGARFETVPASIYLPHRSAAERRLRAGGQSDWHVLAAALALGGDIWSEDLDFFGVGVPVWTSANVILGAGNSEDGDGGAI